MMRILVLLAALAGQFAMAGQVFALPDCHGTGTTAHAATNHDGHVHHEAGAADTDCRCPLSLHCGHAATAVDGGGGFAVTAPQAMRRAIPQAADTALAHKFDPERPPA